MSIVDLSVLTDNEFFETMNNISLTDSSRQEVIELSDDFLAIACALYDIREANENKRFIDFEDLDLSRITQSHRTEAENIRRYYASHFIQTSLKTGNLTSWQTVVSKIITHRTNAIERGWKQVLYRLPEYYRESSRLDKMILDWPTNTVIEQISYHGEYTLRFVDRFKRTSRLERSNDYWFMNEFGNPVRIRILRTDFPDSGVLQVFERAIQQPITIRGHFKSDSIGSFNYMLSDKKWTLI